MIENQKNHLRAKDFQLMGFLADLIYRPIDLLLMPADSIIYRLCRLQNLACRCFF